MCIRDRPHGGIKIAVLAQIIGACAMNNLPSMKIAKLHDTIFQIDKQLVDQRTPQNDSVIRKLVDKRRHTLAQMQIETAADPLFAQHQNGDVYATNSQTQNFINTWCSRVKHAAQDIISFENDEFCNLFIDHILPQKWNFDNDTIIVISPPSYHICLLYTSPSPRDRTRSRMPSSA